MTARLLYLVGEPGVGKTTAMAAYTSRFDRVGTLTEPLPRIVFATPSGAVAAIELGRRRPGGFSGTDALAMTAIGPAERYLRSGQAAGETSLLLAEGARLANRRFLLAALAAGWAVTLVHLRGPECAAERREARGSRQSPAWVRGAATRAARLADDPPGGVRVVELPAGGSSHDIAARLALLAR